MDELFLHPAFGMWRGDGKGEALASYNDNYNVHTYVIVIY